MVDKELREPAKGLDFIGACSCRQEAGAESCFCTHTLKVCDIATGSSRNH